MRWYFLASFLAVLIICGILVSFLLFALIKHDPRAWKVALFVLPQLALFGQAGRVMFRSFMHVETQAEKSR